MSHNDKTYTPDCDECREYNREFHNQDMEVFVEKTGQMIDAKFQTRQDIIADVNSIKKDLRWMKPAIAVIGGAIILITIYLFG